jgi:hypothetical protein
MKQTNESLGSFWDEWQKETEELAQATREKVEKIKKEALERQRALEDKKVIQEDI